MKKTGIYVRVSTDNQSIDAQLHSIKKYCESQGIANYCIYSDEGISGAAKSRPALDNLIDDVENCCIDTVICYSLSRISRTTTHLLKVLERFQELNIDFISLSENISLSTPAGKLMVTVLGAVYELERSIIRERVMSGLANAKAQGKKLGAPKRRNSALIRELYRQGMSYRKIAALARVSIGTVHAEINACSLKQSA